MRSFESLRDRFFEHIELLKVNGFEADDLGALWIVSNGRYTGYGDTELQAWSDLLMDVILANEILDLFDVA